MALLARRRPHKRTSTITGTTPQWRRTKTSARRGFDPDAFDRDMLNQALYAWKVGNVERVAAAGQAIPGEEMLSPTSSINIPVIPVPTVVQPNRCYQLHIALIGIEPQIWRRLEVPGNVTLVRLHRMVQAALGWEAIELHRFVVGGVEYGPPGLGLGMRSSRAVRL